MLTGSPQQIIASEAQARPGKTALPIASQMLDLLRSEGDETNEEALLALESAIQEIRTHLRNRTSFANQPHRGLATWQVKRVTNYMLENIDQNIELGQLAALVKLSRSHFCTAFRYATGYTPLQWLSFQRVERAKELLANRALSITEIALSVGYETPSAFTAGFRRTCGFTPSDFRKGIE